MSIINIQNLTFSYPGNYENIFENVSFRIDTDWKLGFTGRNGRGKTTFLQLLQGIYPYEGTISSSVIFDYFPYPIANPSLFPVDIAEQICPNYEFWQLCKELSLLDVDCDVLYRPFDTLSNGEQTKVLLAILFLQDHHFLLIDEPTNHLDIKARDLVGDYLNKKHGFILVSHDRAFLDRCVDHILSINKSSIDMEQGNFSSWWQNKSYRDQFEQAENEKLKKEIKRLTHAARRTANWSEVIEARKCGFKNSGLRPDRGYLGHQSAKMMQRAKNVTQRKERALDEKSQLLRDLERADPLKLRPLSHSKQKLIELSNVTITYGKYGAKTVAAQTTFTICQGDRIALQGKNGCGKSSILKLICGETLCFQGDFSIASGLKISYVPQDASFLQGNLTDFALQHNIDESLLKTILRKFDFSREQFAKNMKDFSAGQKKKVLLAASLCEQAHLYVWDEPLNYIDVLSRIQIETLLSEYQPTMIFVEHDRAFVNRIATNIVTFI